MTKVCNHKKCKRTHDTKFKTCPHCRERNRKSLTKMRKRFAQQKMIDGLKICSRCGGKHDTKFKRMCPACRAKSKKYRAKRENVAAKKVVQEGFQRCKNCFISKPQTDFESIVHRRKKMTSLCQHCRDSQRKKLKNPSTKVGKCREFWRNWKEKQKCVDCGIQDSRVIEADHVRGSKIHDVGHYMYWASHGGIPAMKKELEKCVPRCRICHTLKTKERHDLKREKERRKVTKRRRHNEINAIKIKIGKCLHCSRKVTPETCCAFDFDHKDEEIKIISISNLANKSQKFYDEHLHSEIEKCQLLCRNCHHLKTHYPKDKNPP